MPLCIFALTKIDSARKELALSVLPDLRNHFHVEKLTHTFLLGGGSLFSVLFAEELPIIFPETESIVEVKGLLPLCGLLLIASEFVDVGDILLLLGEDPGGERDLLGVVGGPVGLEGLEIDSIHSQCCYNYIIPEIILRSGLGSHNLLLADGTHPLFQQPVPQTLPVVGVLAFYLKYLV